MKTVPTRLDFIKALPPGTTGAEIGVYRGDFSEQILRETKVGCLFLVDPWTKQPDYNDTINDEDQEAHYQETLRKTAPYRPYRCEIIRDFSNRVALDMSTLMLEPLLDWVFVDAYHAYEAALEDITLWSRKLKPGGIIFCHDYFVGPKTSMRSNTWSSGVPQAVAEFMRQNPGWSITHITTADELPTVRLFRVA